MRQILFSVFILLASVVSLAQTTATDFTTLDCNGVSHNLFSELDSGKVIVIAWVMPCEFCVDGAKAGWSAKQNYETSHPGRVRFYLVSDFGDDSCTTLATWANTNNVGVGTLTSFENVGKPINMNDYGTGGMPKVVVVGGSSHYVFFNKNFSPANDPMGISNAIAEALVGNAPTSISKIEENENMTLQFSNNQLWLPKIDADEIFISNANGQIIKRVKLGTSETKLHVENLSKGVYFVELNHKGRHMASGKFVN